jgi:hypothetical protein
MRIVEPPALQKVFALSTPMHLYAKLAWELKAFKRALSRDVLSWHLHAAYHAFNCAVTAWHLSDWIWEYISASERQELATQFGLRNADLGSFQGWITKQSRALNCCREIATGSKHRVVKRRSADSNVRASLEWGRINADVNAGVNEPLAKYRVRLVIYDSKGVREAVDVFTEALEYWRTLLAPWQEDRYVGPGRRGARRSRAV